MVSHWVLLVREGHENILELSYQQILCHIHNPQNQEFLPVLCQPERAISLCSE